MQIYNANKLGRWSKKYVESSFSKAFSSWASRRYIFPAALVDCYRLPQCLWVFTDVYRVFIGFFFLHFPVSSPRANQYMSPVTKLVAPEDLKGPKL